MKIWTVSVIALLVALRAGHAYQHSLAYALAAPEDRYGLWISVPKGFEGTSLYVGTIGEYSFFRVGDLICSRYKAPTPEMRLPRTFRLGEGSAYVVTFEMVPSFP